MDSGPKDTSAPDIVDIKHAAATEELSIQVRNLLTRVRHVSGTINDDKEIRDALRKADWALDQLEKKASRVLNNARNFGFKRTY